MSGKIIIPDGLQDLTANVLPVLIHYNGEANTHTYFTPYKRTLPSGETEAQFRGLRLLGKESLLGNKTGYVCEPSEYLQPNPSGSEEPITCKQFVGTMKFEKLVVFGHDTLPPSTGKHLLFHELDEIAEAIHG